MLPSLFPGQPVQMLAAQMDTTSYTGNLPQASMGYPYFPVMPAQQPMAVPGYYPQYVPIGYAPPRGPSSATFLGLFWFVLVYLGLSWFIMCYISCFLFPLSCFLFPLLFWFILVYLGGGSASIASRSRSQRGTIFGLQAPRASKNNWDCRESTPASYVETARPLRRRVRSAGGTSLRRITIPLSITQMEPSTRTRKPGLPLRL